ncbi:MAG TPA: heat-shock protein Hsp20 [Cyanobacteria bacterium UBA8543]|nr:heat-shock protein Hsp20 [Cyanobacteria bacterium UBA8543]
MLLIRWKALRELDALRQQINRLFDELVHGEREFGLLPKIHRKMDYLFDELVHNEREFNLFPKNSNATWVPAIELKETDTDLILKGEVPGIDAKDLDVRVSQNAVSIAGEHKEEKQIQENGFFRSELCYGQFQRIVPLPVSIKNDQVKAELNNGFLTLTLPKAEVVERNVVKVDLSMQQKAREAMTQQRRHEQHLQQTMHARAEAELETPMPSDIQEEVRESMTGQRQHDEHLQDTMLSRSATEVGATNYDG